jgi:predicted MFS family arabinose efflux permease
LIGGFFIARYGWRAFFIGLGLGGMVWLAPWWVWMPRDRAAQKAQAADAATLLEIVRKRAFLATCGGLFCANYFWYFLLTWLPYYLVRHRGFSMDKMAVLGALAYFAIGVSAVVSGWVSDRWIAAGAPAARVRRGFAATGLACSTVILPVASVRGEQAAIALLVAACLAFGIFSSNHWALTQTLAGPKAAGKWTSLENGVGNLAGVVSPWLTGAVVQWTGSFVPAFLLAGGFALGGMAMYRFGIGRTAQVIWKARS